MGERIAPALRQLHRLNEQIERQEDARVAWLRQQGWKYSSSLPGSLWLWSKDFPESDVQWIWQGSEKVPRPPFSINGATTEVAIAIEGAWLSYWTREGNEVPG